MKEIFSEKDKILLKKIVKIVAKSGRCSLDRPKRFFLETMFCFRRAGGEIDTKKSIGNYTREEMAFMKVIDELGIKLKRGVLAEYPRVITTPAMQQGAKAVDNRHHKMLGNDY